MLKLKRSFLLLLVLFLAACGTQTQVPEAALDDSTNIEVLKSGGKVNVHYKKYVVGHEPKGAKYKIELICKTNDKRQKVVLKQTVDIHKYKGYAFKKSYYGVGGYRCVVREIGNEHKGYYVGDHVVIQVKQKGKLIGYAAKHTSSRFQTVETPRFKVGKHGTVHVYVTNKFKKVDKKTDITIIKKFYDGKKYVEVKGEAKIYLVCKVGKEYKVVASFAASKYTEFKTQQYAGLECYLKESFHDDSYTLEDVQISLESGKWGEQLDTNWRKDGYVVSEYFHLPKSPLKIIFVNVVKEKEEEKKTLELVIKKDFESDYKKGDPEYGNVVVKLICTGYKSDAFTLGDGGEKVLELYDDYKDCVLKESYTNDHYVLKHVSFNGTPGTVDGHSATSPKFDLKLEDGRIVIIIINGVEKKEEEQEKKLVLEIVKTFELEGKQVVVPANIVVKFDLVCGSVTKTVTLTSGSTTSELRGTIELDGKYVDCVLIETFSSNDYALLAVSLEGTMFSLTTDTTTGTVTATSEKFNIANYDGDDIKKILLDIVNEIESKKKAA